MSFPTRYHARVKYIFKNNMLAKYRYKKTCKVCEGEGFTHIDSDNKLVCCPRCINVVEAKKDYEILENEIAINTV